MPMDETDNAPGLRERKRRETKKRITDAGMELFIRNGFEATTLDEIAAEAEISRRSIFHYFSSKDDILLSVQSGMGEMMAASIHRQKATHKSPLQTLRDAVVEVAKRFEDHEMIRFESLMRSNPSTQARWLASYVEHEHTLYLTLRDIWPSEERQVALRMVSMVAMGTLRVALDAYAEDRKNRNVARLVDERFAAIMAEL